MTPYGLAAIAEAFPAAQWPRKERAGREAMQALSHMSDDDILVKCRALKEQGIIKVSVAHFAGKVLSPVGSGEVADLGEDEREEIFRTWPNLRLYAHEERTMQAAWRKLKGIPPLKKADIDRLAEVHPNIYGPQAKARQDIPDTAAIGNDRANVLRMLVLATREEIAAGVSHCRSVAALTGEALPSDVTEWKPYQRGIVWAAMDKQGVFR